MRIPCLLVVSLSGLVSLCVASDAARPISSSHGTSTSFNTDSSNPPAIANRDFIKLPASARVDRPDRGSFSEQDGDVTCYTMHIFAMKRESRNSDVTVPDGQRTCQRASKYGVKATQESDQPPTQ